MLWLWVWWSVDLETAMELALHPHVESQDLEHSCVQ
jgi:hypothetical protein